MIYRYHLAACRWRTWIVIGCGDGSGRNRVAIRLDVRSAEWSMMAGRGCDLGDGCEGPLTHPKSDSRSPWMIQSASRQMLVHFVMDGLDTGTSPRSSMG